MKTIPFITALAAGLSCVAWGIVRRRQAGKEFRAMSEELEERVSARTAELAEVNRELESFTYTVSHDLQAPLRVIEGYLKLLREQKKDQIDAEALRFIDAAQKGTGKMSRLIDDLMAFSRVSRQDIYLSPVDMEEVVRSVFEELEPSRQGRAVDLVVKPLSPALGDHPMIRQVVFNLLSNAVKFTRPRERAVIEVGSFLQGYETVYYIKDNGVGFEGAYAGKLFNVFQRLHSEKEFEGTGAGLAIVQRIVQRHGGRAWAEGKKNEGATFYFSLLL